MDCDAEHRDRQARQRHARGGRGRREHLVMAKDRRLEFAQRRGWFQAQFLAEGGPELAVDLQGLGLPAAAVQGEHELAAQPLAQRVPGHHPAEFGGERAGDAERQLRLVAFFQARQPEFFQPADLGLRERLVAEVGQRRAAPQRHRLVEQLRGLGRAARGERVPALEDELPELGGVQLGREDPQQVAGRGGDQAAGRQQPPQPGDRRLQRVRRAGRDVLAPQVDQQLLARQHLVGVQQQVSEHGTLPDAADRDLPAAVLQMERAEDPYPHRPPPPRPSADY